MLDYSIGAFLLRKQFEDRANRSPSRTKPTGTVIDNMRAGELCFPLAIVLASIEYLIRIHVVLPGND